VRTNGVTILAQQRDELADPALTVANLTGELSDAHGTARADVTGEHAQQVV